jgi:parallel beta-helix repeat protein
MKRKAVMLMLILSLAASIVTTISSIDLTKANAIPQPERLPVNQAYIRSDGSIDPPTLPIERLGNNYVLKENIVNCSITIEKDDVVIDGTGFSMSIPLYGEKGADGQVKSVPALIQISNRTHVTVRNFNFHNASTAVSVFNSSYINIIDNRITHCNWIYLDLCKHCSIIKNIIENNTHGLYGYENNFIDIKYNQISGSSWHAVILEFMSNSNIIGNIFAENNGQGICYLGSNNRVIGNVFQDNEGGILSYVEGNEIHHNNFINNREDIAINAPNILDDGKEGNYWSSNQHSKPLVIPSVFIRDNASNIDNFPRTTPYTFDYKPPVLSVISPENKTYTTGNLAVNFTASEEISKATYSLDGNQTVPLQDDAVLTGLSEGTHHLTVYAEDMFGNEGTSTVSFAVYANGPPPKAMEPPNLFPVILAVSASVAAIASLLVGLKVKQRNQK